MSAGPVLDAESLRRWLVGPEVVDVDGAVWSWRGEPAGYRYAEAGGLWLSWITMVDPQHARAPAVARWLERALVEGGVGRDGVGYTFDLGVVLTGLLRWRQATGAGLGYAVRRGAAELVAAITERRAVTGAAHARWSTRFGPHQRKLAIALDRIDEAALLDTTAARAALCLATGDEPLELVGQGAEPIYLHAAAYALEGSWSLGATETVARGASWLAEIQRDDGGLSAWWHPRQGAHGPARADATAQAVRLWCGADPQRHAAAIDRGLGFLAGLHDPRGGVRYDDVTPHRNVWCALFSWQALQFASGNARAETLL